MLSNSTTVVFHDTRSCLVSMLHDLLLHNYKILEQHSKSEPGLTTNTPSSTEIKTFSNPITANKSKSETHQSIEQKAYSHSFYVSGLGFGEILS